jgi:hypothetical protein
LPLAVTSALRSCAPKTTGIAAGASTKHRDLEHADVDGASEQRATPDAVCEHPRSEEDREPAGDRDHVEPDREAALGRVGDLEEEDQRQDRHGAGQHVA